MPIVKKAEQSTMDLLLVAFYFLPKSESVIYLVNARVKRAIKHNCHNWPLQSFNQDCNLASYTTHVVCVHFIHEWWGLHFKVDSESQIFEKLFHGNFIFSQSVCQKFTEKMTPKKYFNIFVLMSDLGFELLISQFCIY